jgi:cytoskeleton protein RodZ
VLEKGIVIAGQSRSFEAGRVGRVVLGNSGGVDVRVGHAAVDLAPFSRANVARFALSSDGSPTPVLD